MPEPIDFPQAFLNIAKDQPQYRPLPAYYYRDHETLTFCWRLSWLERVKLLFVGKLWHTILTFGGPLQPQLIEVNKPTFELLTDEEKRGRKLLRVSEGLDK